MFTNVFYLQTESVQKPLEITSEKVLESILRWETIKSPKSSLVLLADLQHLFQKINFNLPGGVPLLAKGHGKNDNDVHFTGDTIQ